MKKFFAVLLAALLCMSAALAETADFVTVSFEDIGITMNMPTAWCPIEVTEEQEADGVIYIFANAENVDDATQKMWICYFDLGTVYDIDGLAAELTELYGLAAPVEINGISAVAAVSEAEDLNIVALLAADGTGAYGMYFAPGSDLDLSELGQTIVQSMAFIEE